MRPSRPRTAAHPVPSGLSPARLAEVGRRYWDADAATLDIATASEVATPGRRAAWRAALAELLGPAPSTVLDVGAGTGFMSLVVAELGHTVTAIDYAPSMLERLTAHADACGLAVTTVLAAAEEPPEGPFDTVIARNVLWTLADPASALDAWRTVAPTGRLVVIEGAWGAAGGRPEELRARARSLAARAAGPRQGAAHHAPLPAEISQGLPHAEGIAELPARVLVASTAWGPAASRRLCAVERTERRAGGWLARILGVTPRYAVLAGAGTGHDAHRRR